MEVEDIRVSLPLFIVILYLLIATSFLVATDLDVELQVTSLG